MTNQEYEQTKQSITDKYWKKNGKIIKNSLIAWAVPAIMGMTSMMGMGTSIVKNLILERNTPIYKEYEANQNSLSYLRERLNLSKTPLPKYLAPQISSGLEKLETIDSTKISALERAIKIAQDDSSRIVNTPEAKEWSNKIDNINSWTDLTKYLFALTLLPAVAMSTMTYINDKRKKEEIKSLKESYGIKE